MAYINNVHHVPYIKDIYIGDYCKALPKIYE